MTFHDPASIESGCVYARGRNHKRHRVEMLSNIVFWVILIELQIICFGIPTTPYYTDVPAEWQLNSTADAFTHDDVEILNDTASLGTKNLSKNSGIFIDVPQHTETALGTSVLLVCRTAEPVVDCQWSWRPLPPVNLPLPDINPLLNSNETTHEVVAVSPTATTQSVPVQSFPAFGNNSNDCSVRFKHIKHEQIGYWTCAVRSTNNDTFISTKPVMLSIANDKIDMSGIIFNTSDDVETHAGSPIKLICQTSISVNECRWYWRLFNQSEQYNVAIKNFNAFNNDNTDCSIKFDNVLLEQEGIWTCGVRIDINSTFIKAKPINLFVSEVKFVQLSQGIQAAAGESALLRCLVDKPVVQCQWSWKPLNSNKEPKVMRKFPPNNDNKPDCAVRFKNVLHEVEGMWTCGVRLTLHGRLHEAEPAKLTLLPSASKFTFTEIPENNSVVIGSNILLKCAASSRVETCTWLWRPLIDDVEMSVKNEYIGYGNLGNNCSHEFSEVRIEDQGYWSCRVSFPSSNTVLTSPWVRLIVYNEGTVEFSVLSKHFQNSLGSSVFLKCTTSSPVEKCQWSFTPANSNTTIVFEQLSPVDNESKDCSVRLSHALAEQQGLWTCSVKPYGKNTYINAQPAKLELLEPESVKVALWTNSHELVTLACKLYPIPINTKCQWVHLPDNEKQNEISRKLRQDLKMNQSNGICTLQFKPEVVDLGEWMCKFVTNIDNTWMELGNATVTLLFTHTESHRLGWIVGTVTTLVLFLIILTVVLVVFKARLFNKRNSRVFETASKTNRKYSKNKNHHRSFGKRSTTLGVLNNPTISHDHDTVNNIQSNPSQLSQIYENFTTL